MKTLRCPSSSARSLSSDLFVALLAALLGTAWLSWLNASDGVRPGDAIAVVNESATIFGFTLPLVMLAVPALLAALRRGGARATSLAAVTGVAAASAVAVSLG